MEQLLIVEDDIGLNQGLCKALKADDRQIISCHDLKAASRSYCCVFWRQQLLYYGSGERS